MSVEAQAVHRDSIGACWACIVILMNQGQVSCKVKPHTKRQTANMYLANQLRRLFKATKCRPSFNQYGDPVCYVQTVETEETA